MVDLDYCQRHSRLASRGPDCSGRELVSLTCGWNLLLEGHVLYLRGDRVAPQPAVHSNGDILLWNGEIFGGIQVSEHVSDTSVLLNLLSACQDEGQLLNIMSSIHGPWSFVFWQHSCKRLWFGRDVFGRRSLLWHLPEDESDVLLLSSVHIQTMEFKEVPAVGIFCVKCDESFNSRNPFAMTLYPYERVVWPATMDPVVKEDDLATRLYAGSLTHMVKFELNDSHTLRSQIPALNKDIPHDSYQKELLEKETPQEYLQKLLENDELFRKASLQLLSILEKAVLTRVLNQPSKKVIRSYKTNDRLSTNDVTDSGSEQDRSCHENHLTYQGNCKNLCNAAEKAENRLKTSVAAEESILSQIEKETLESSVTTTSNHVHVSEKRAHCGKHESSGVSDVSVQDEESRNYMEKSKCNMSNENGATECSAGSQGEKTESESNVAILFSGGIDSTVIAALADRVLPSGEPVDLINVAFEQQVKNTSKDKKNRSPAGIDSDMKWKVPDRETGHQALLELNPERPWNFIEVNVTAEELQQTRSSHIRHLVYPLTSVLDDSIGCAVWFAARGCGIMGNGPFKGQQVISKARVILCGMGADEQLVGYSRHRVKFKEHGWQGLLEEIELEITRISARNLGRDDRIITDHGKESRFPFLDENVVHFLSSLPLNIKADLTLPRGLGEKLLLRLCALQLGLEQTASFPKRAIQFGSRIAKLENSKEKGTDVCDRLK